MLHADPTNNNIFASTNKVVMFLSAGGEWLTSLCTPQRRPQTLLSMWSYLQFFLGIVFIWIPVNPSIHILMNLSIPTHITALQQGITNMIVLWLAPNTWCIRYDTPYHREILHMYGFVLSDLIHIKTPRVFIQLLFVWPVPMDSWDPGGFFLV